MRVPIFLAALIVAAGCVTVHEPERRASLDQAQAFLLCDPYPDLRIEIAHVAQYPPHPRAIDALSAELAKVVDKRRIEFARPIELTGEDYQDPDRRWSIEEAYAIADGVFTPYGERRYGTGETALLRVLYLNGYVEAYSRELGGLSLDGLALIFPDRFHEFLPDELRDLGVPIAVAERVKLERWMLLHELGHNLGLVGLEVPMQHERRSPDGLPHSTSEASVMYMWNRGGSAWRELEEGAELPYTFDEHDLADFAEYGRASGVACA